MFHGLEARSAGVIADLRLMSPGAHNAFEQIVLGGALSGKGIAYFEDVLSPEGAEQVPACNIAPANEDGLAAQQ